MAMCAKAPRAARAVSRDSPWDRTGRRPGPVLYSPWVVVRVLALVLLLLAGAAIGAPMLVALDACTESCPDDDTGGDCPPACTSCTCCTHSLRPVILGRALPASTTPPARQAGPVYADPAPAVPEPHDIFHVPKRTLA